MNFKRAMRSLVLLALLAGPALAGLPAWVQLQPAGTPNSAVPFAEVKSIADMRARTMWASPVSGDILPYVDIDGNLIAWVFHYRIDGKPFPDYTTAAAEIAEEMPSLADPKNHSRYAYVLTSARYDRAPVLCYGEGGTEFFMTLAKARALAAAQVGAEPKLSRVYYVWPLSYYEFTGADKSIVIEAHILNRTWTPPEFADYVRVGEQSALAFTGGGTAEAKAFCADKMRAEWNFYQQDPGAFETTNVFVSQPELAPFYDWSYGCSPTSGTMVVGYLDRQRSYGRCIYDFFERWDCAEGQTDYQIPKAQRDMAICFQTETIGGGTGMYDIGPGLADFGTTRGYAFDMVDVVQGYWADWAWWADSQEIAADHPMVWSCTWQRHSLAAYGFRVPSKDMYVHNTWWMPAAWWHYTDGGSGSYAGVAAVNPSGGSPHNTLLVFPRGDTQYAHNGAGEALYVGHVVTVRWNNFGSPADSVTMDLSTDGGWNWSNLAHGIPDNGSYLWDVSPSTPANEQARLRIKTFSQGQYVAGDGSQGNFKLMRTPLSPIPLSPPSGRFLNSLPVVLLADTVVYADSYSFRMDWNGDTVLRYTATVPRCSLPDSLITNNQLYGWSVRARNSFGWGEYSGRWTFRTRFSAVEEEAGAEPLELAAPGLGRTPVRVSYSLARDGQVSLTVFDVAGRPVRVLEQGRLQAGRHERLWNRQDEQGREVAAGCYFVRLSTGQHTLVRKLELLK